MNRTIKYISAILLLSSVGCMKAVKDDPVYPGGPLQMTFPAPVVGPASKAVAGPIGATYDTKETFGVYGLYYPSGNFSSWKTAPAGDASYPKGSSIYIDGVEFAHNPAINDNTPGTGGAWISNPVRYWPNQGHLTFAAWSPYRAINFGKLSYAADGLTITGFRNELKAAEQFDLMYSNRVYDMNKLKASQGTNGTYDGIDLVFNHALAAVNFNACSNTDQVKIRITKIEVYGLSARGDFKENITNDSPTSQFARSPKWTLSTAKNDSLTVAAPLVIYEDNTVTNDNVIPNVATAKSRPVGSFMPIPQDLNNAKFKVYYTIQFANAEPVPTVSDEITFSSGTTAGATTAITSWTMSTRYNYTLILGAQQIRFDVDVFGWNDKEPSLN